MKKENKKFNELDYILSVPDNFDKNKKYPSIIFLHGAGGRGRNIDMVRENPYFEITDKYEFETVTFAPQCYAESWFDIFEQLQDFIKSIINLDYVDENRIYIMGASMGGYATWQMAMTHPEWFAAAVPICGGGMYWLAYRLKNLPILAYHGSNDPIVYPEESKKMVDSVNKEGGCAKLTICEGVEHNSWINAYSNKDTFLWLFEQKRQNTTDEENKFGDQQQFG